MRTVILCALLLAGAAQASSIDRFNSFLNTTASARADFQQKVYDRNRRLVQESNGSFAFQRPGRFRWAYERPHPQLVVGDGEKVWIYDQDLNQVTVRRLSRALGSTPAALLAGGADVGRAFVLSEAESRDGLEWLDATPREREGGFERIRVGFGVAGIEAMELVDHFGQLTVLRFSNLARNPKIDPSNFRFTPPAGADVLGE